MRLLVVGALVIAGVLPLLATPSASPRTARPDLSARESVRPAEPLVLGPADAGEPSSPERRLACSTPQAAINPCTTAVTATINRTVKTTFSVQNKTIENENFIITCARTGQAATCSAPGTLVVNHNATANVVVLFCTEKVVLTVRLIVAVTAVVHGLMAA